MPVGTKAQTWQDCWSTRTVRHFYFAVAFAFAAIGVGCLIYFLEKYALGLDRRFVENPASVMMRACGLAHFWIGWLFLFSSSRLRSRPAFLRLSILTCLGIFLCFICGWLGANSNPFIFLFFYSFFLVHEIRDQTNLYQAYEIPNPAREEKQFLHQLQFSAIMLLSSLLCCGYLVHQLGDPTSQLNDIPSMVFLLGVLGLVGLNVWNCKRTSDQATRIYGSLAAALETHRPLMVVYFGVLSILLVGLAMGSVSFNLIIMIHAGAWLVFVTYQLQNNPSGSCGRNLWKWFRRTPTGFITLHILMIGLVLILMASRVHLWQRVGLVSEMVDGENFPYWSLMHISMAFWRE